MAPKVPWSKLQKNGAVKIVDAPVELPPLKIAAYWDPSRTDNPRVKWVLESVLGPARARREAQS
ncbi:MAG: hypothetical protein GY822_03940 [Deltaproteobacteria bacterium]|nr:hypothetical protein [Deltaproteobacteria bacterium]